MKQEKLTRAEQRKAIYAHNRQSILERGVLTENKYNDLWLDAGRKFLEALYPTDETSYQDYFKRFYTSRSFWKWWFKKWQDWEDQLLTEAKQCEVELNHTIYTDSMLPIIYDYRTETNFLDYIKHLEYAL